jgi:hypothetical protein
MELVSIGIAREDGAEMYAINQECLSNVMRHPWLATTAVPHLPIRSDDPFIFEWNKEHQEYQHVLALDRLIAEVLQFITEADKPDLWAYYGAFKHVVLSQLFGSMAERPSRVPMFTHELQQLAEERVDLMPLPPAPENTHHAMADARWVKQAHAALTGTRTQLAAEPYRPAHGLVVGEANRVRAKVLGWGDVYDAQIIEEDK